MSRATTHQTDIERQLADLERQGGSMARLAHLCAGALLLVFSAGSLISLSYAALQTLIRTWEAGRGLDIPNAINTAVNPLLVVAMDVAMLYAASVLRVLASGRAPREEMRVHVAVLAGASLLESATYLYMTWQFDRPANGWLWVIAVGRAAAAPLFAVYLSMARPLPVAPRDVAYQTSLHSGRGVIRDVATLAADPAAPLERKVRIYSASSRMTGADARQFAGIIAAVSDEEEGEQPRPPTPAPEDAGLIHFRPSAARGPSQAPALPAPISVPAAAYADPEPQPDPRDDTLDALVERAGALRATVRPPEPRKAVSMSLAAQQPRREQPKRASIGLSHAAQLELHARRKAAARQALSADPEISARELARRVAIATKHGISPSKAQEIRAEIRAEVERERQAAPATSETQSPRVVPSGGRSEPGPFRGGPSDGSEREEEVEAAREA